MAVSFVREATLDAVRDELAAVGASASRIDAAPMPVWALVADRTRTAIVVRDADAAWVAGVDAHGAPRFFRPLHAAPSDPDAIAREVARTFTAWRVRPERVLLGGPGSSAWRAAIERTSAVACEELAFPTEVDPALADDPLAAGALLTLARRKDLPLALVAPAILPTARRRRLAGLATAAVLLLVAQGALTRMELASRLRALEVGITAVTRDAGPRAAMAFERLDAVTEPVDLPAEDPALARLYEVVSHVPTPTLQLQRLQIDAKHVTLVGRLPSFDAVEALRRGLERSPRLTDLRVAEMRASVDATGVEFRLEGRWLRSGEQPS